MKKRKCCNHHESERIPFEELAGKLRSEECRVTGPRRAILELLSRHPHPMTNREILENLEPGYCDLATVYRSMHLLEKMELVQRFDFGDGAARYELNHREKQNHHHHLICRKCSTIVEIEECFSRELEQQIAEKNGFKAISHKLEFFGLCPACQ